MRRVRRVSKMASKVEDEQRVRQARVEDKLTFLRGVSVRRRRYAAERCTCVPVRHFHVLLLLVLVLGLAKQLRELVVLEQVGLLREGVDLCLADSRVLRGEGREMRSNTMAIHEREE